VAMALTPAAAEASPKLANMQAKAGGKAACAVTAGQTWRAAPADISRAILGGAPSALDRIRAEQATEAVAVPVAAGLGAAPVRQTLEPASRGPISFATPLGGCGTASFLSPLAETDATAELGTRAIPVRRTRFDDRWDRVRRAAP